jgi:hypothetical protein
MLTALRAGLLISIWLFAACDELPAYDDPRGRPEYREAKPPPSGKCSGSYVRCKNRRPQECEGGGCYVEDACHLRQRDRCLSHDTPDSCDRDSVCWWVANVCEVRGGSGCTSSSEYACLSAEYSDCAWGPSCAGYATFCSSHKEQEECEANLGCAWTED